MSFQIISVWFMTCLPAINARAMSNEDDASIGYIGCHIAHVLEMRTGKINMASSPLAESGSQPIVLLFYSLHGIDAIVHSIGPSVFTRRGRRKLPTPQQPCAIL